LWLTSFGAIIRKDVSTEQKCVHVSRCKLHVD
jgi:hypothetical protein